MYYVGTCRIPLKTPSMATTLVPIQTPTRSPKKAYDRKGDEAETTIQARVPVSLRQQLHEIEDQTKQTVTQIMKSLVVEYIRTVRAIRDDNPNLADKDLHNEAIKLLTEARDKKIALRHIS